jgi:hypothetical protein
MKALLLGITIIICGCSARSNQTSVTTFDTYCRLDGGMPSPVFDSNYVQTSTCTQVDEFWASSSGAARHSMQCNGVISDHNWLLKQGALEEIRAALETSDFEGSKTAYACPGGCGADQRSVHTSFSTPGVAKSIDFPDGPDAVPAQLKPAVDLVCALPDEPR